MRSCTCGSNEKTATLDLSVVGPTGVNETDLMPVPDDNAGPGDLVVLLADHDMVQAVVRDWQDGR